MEAFWRISVKAEKHLVYLCREWYLTFCSAERRYLLSLLQKTSEERLWAHFLAKELLAYRFYRITPDSDRERN